MSKHGKKKDKATDNRTYNGKKFSDMTPTEKMAELSSSLGNPTQYAKDNFTPLKPVQKNKHGK